MHIYFEKEDILKATDLINEIKSLPKELKVGRMRKEPLGPHPTGSCQITVAQNDFEFLVNWLMLNRKGFDIFIHALTGDDVFDHTEAVMWIGHERKLNLDFL